MSSPSDCNERLLERFRAGQLSAQDAAELDQLIAADYQAANTRADRLIRSKQRASAPHVLGDRRALGYNMPEKSTVARNQRMATIAQKRATLDDLYRTPEKAELIGGRIVYLMSTGRKPNRVAFRIVRSLDDHANQIGVGEAFTDNMGFEVPMLPSGREAFSTDGSYHKGPFPKNPMRFIKGAPSFAAEVRSENDYTPSAETEMAEKRTDYFLAGTEVVWDVDTVAECVHVYRATDPEHPVTYRRGETAEAEPAVPGWRIAVESIFS